MNFASAGKYGAVCQIPSVVRSVKLEDAFWLLNCTASTPTILSTTVSSPTEVIFIGVINYMLCNK